MSNQISTLQAIHSETSRTSSTMESNLALTMEKLSIVTRESSMANQEKERLSTTNQHLEATLKKLNSNYDSVCEKLKAAEMREREGMDAKLKLQDRYDTLVAQVVRHFL